MILRTMAYIGNIALCFGPGQKQKYIYDHKYKIIYAFKANPEIDFLRISHQTW